MHTTGDINQAIRRPPGEVGFPDAPAGWTAEDAREIADADGLYLSDAHWDVVRALQSYFARHEGGSGANLRDLHDALDERFHASGGLRELSKLFPGGTVAQG